MCHPARCRSCGKTTWSGCGRHVAEVQAKVPTAQWCAGHPDELGTGVLRRLFGRRT